MARPKARVISVNDRLPKPGRWVIVVTATYRCMGYLDKDGKWKDVQRHEVIEAVQAWSPAGDDDTVIFPDPSK